ncbi:MAG: hypothetical protein K2Q10_07755, partial [Rhodospirillales bacterium]|nr:hypothetical protein [Rhodospirillales bacterium]
MENGGTVPPNRTYQVAVCGHPLSATYYFPPFMVFTKKLDEADFLISFTQADCDTHFDGRQIVSVERLGAELSVVKDRRYLRKEHQPEPPATASEPQPVP